MKPIKIIEWLRECYLADRAWHGFTSLTAGKVENHRVIQGDEVLASALVHESVVTPQYAEKLLVKTQLYAREKELLYGCLSVCGFVDGRPVITPLIIYPATLQSDSVGAYSIDLRRWRFNPPALRVLELTDEAIDDLSDRLSSGVVDHSFIFGLEKWLNGSAFDTEALDHWPKLERSTVLQKASKGKTYSLYPSAHLFLAKRSVNTRGVLQELAGMTVGGALSQPIDCLIGGITQLGSFRHKSVGSHYVPDLLSEAQNKALLASRKHTLSVCHGPPGTGKSYTIAAMAIDCVSRGQSVLIVSQQDAAVDVVGEKLESMAGGEYLTVRGGRGKRRKELSDFLARYLAKGAQPDREKSAQKGQIKALKKTIAEIEDIKLSLAEAMERSVQSGEMLAGPSDSLLKKIQLSLKMFRFEKKPLLSEIYRALEEMERGRKKQAIDLMKSQLEMARQQAIDCKKSYASLKMFSSALKARNGKDQAERFAKVDHRVIRDMFPVWLVALDDLHNVVPFEQEIFDLVIIDEASQCDLAQVMPALFRAKRAVIVGDRKQLRHVSFLSMAKQLELAKRHQLEEGDVDHFNYRNRSLMDVAVDSIDDAGATSLLNEHFRSRSDIIGFSNQRFYGGGMHVMSERSWGQEEDVLQLIQCQGVRSQNGVNAVEVAYVVKLLSDYVLEGGVTGEALSLGVISPFRNQVEAIRRAISESLSPEIVRELLMQHQLKVETAHGFQGDERDVMILSISLDPNSPHGAQRFLEREGVFNVMITRAKQKQVVLSSVNIEGGAGSLLGDYLDFCEKPPTGGSAENTHHDSFVHQVDEALVSRGYQTRCFSQVSGVSVDIIAAKGAELIGIDLIGYPEASRDYLPLEKLRQLSRAGMQVMPLSFAEWVKKGEGSLDSILTLQARG